ncbi:glycosyl transferase family 9 [Pseudonocardiaceae bacterium YIM PH 21723]|nr:glycosyl transferase family 9 [Pseudonocardiaceae bacterium YIM PH 21723]
MAAVTALDSITGTGITYRGPRAALMRRCALPVTTSEPEEGGNHVLTSGGPAPIEVAVIPEVPPTWLDLVDGEHVQVHAALPMRYYLDLEQRLGVRLPLDTAPAPRWYGAGSPRPGRVLFVGATSRPDRKDYGQAGFLAIAENLAARRPGLSFAMISAREPLAPAASTAGIEMLGALDALDVLDVFAETELVIGNDTGLTHLAALTERGDGSSPQVLGIYSRHAHAKWTTGRVNHHAVATPFSALLSVADRCPVRDRLEDTLWGPASAIGAVPPAAIAEAAGSAAGWW